MLLRSLMIGPCRRRQPSLQTSVCGRHTQSHSEPLGADPEVFLLIRATLDRLNLRVKPADAVVEGGVLAARDRLVMGRGVEASERHPGARSSSLARGSCR
jgi:hypothetical protein